MTADSRFTLAFVGGFWKPAETQPHGTHHAAYLLCRALAGVGDYRALEVYRDPTSPTPGTLLLPSAPPATLLPKSRLRHANGRLVAIYVANGEQKSSVPHVLRPTEDWAPVICTIGTAHSEPQWANLFIALASNAVRPTDGFIFKSRAAERLFRETWSAWTTRFGFAGMPASTVIPNGVDLDENRFSEAARVSTRRRLRLADEDVVFLAFSRLSPGTKGDQQALIARWKDVLVRSPKALLLLSGAVVDRAFAADLRHLARQAGVASRTLVIDDPIKSDAFTRTQLMSASDVFIHLSTGVEETSPLVVHEALAHGLPVVAAAWAGVPEIVEEGVTGFLIPTFHGSFPPDLAATGFGQIELSLQLAASRLVGIDGVALVRAVEQLCDVAIRGRMRAAAVAGRERHDVNLIARMHARFVTEVSTAAERAWRETMDAQPGPNVPAFPVFPVFPLFPLFPLFALDRVLSTHATTSLSPVAEVQLADEERLSWLAEGHFPEDRAVLNAVATTFRDRRTVTAAQLAEAIRAARADATLGPSGAIVTEARLLIRLLNCGALALS